MSRSSGTGSADSGGETTAVVDTSSRLPGVAMDAEPWVARGRIGRFTVLRELGRGGMGVVYAAYDDELDRRVALKLVALRRSEDSSGHVRLHREAQALAKLSHPNVVAVYEVGRHEGYTFIAMEFVRGRTLREYLSDNPTQTQRIDALLQAGRGLAAAHDAGLTHRDFKPGNVLVGDDGRVRVADFGLARTEGSGFPAAVEAQPTSPREVPVDASASPLSSPVTTAGTLVGTPAYMAPEQLAAGEADARADQYSFCVTLYEALVGDRPPPAAQRKDQPLNLENVTMPGRLRRIVARGLELEPDRRYPNMEALLADLERARRGSHRAWVALAAAGAVAVAGYGLVAARSAPPACQDVDRPLRAVWNDEVRTQVQGAALASDLSYADATAQRTLTTLDDYARGWVEARHETCAATRIDGTQSEAVMDLRMACLDAGLQELRAASRVLSRVDAKITSKALSIAGSLRPVSRCSDTEALLADVAPPEDPEVREAVEELRGRLADAKTLLVAGRYDEGLELAGPLLTEAEHTGYAPVVVEARYTVGRLSYKAGKFDAGREALERAALDGVAAEHDDLAIAAGSALVYLTGHDQSLIDDAQRWWSFADALVRRRGSRDPHVSALATSYGSALKQAGRLQEAQEQFELVLEIAMRDEGDPYGAAAAYNNLANVFMERRDLATALDHFERALALYEAELPEQHPTLGFLNANIGAVRANRGDWAAAEPSYAKAMRIWGEALGPAHPDVALARVSYASVLRELGRPDEGHTQLEVAVEALRKTGENNPRLAMAEHTLAAFTGGEEALEHHRRALEIREGSLGADHIRVADSLVMLVHSLRQMGRDAEALPHARRAVEIARARLGPQSEEVAKYESVLDGDEAEDPNRER